MDDHAELREMIQAGRDKIEWYRQVDPTMFRTLQDMMKGKDYLDKMPTIVRVLYEFAFITYMGKMRSVKFVYYKLMLRSASWSHKKQQHEEAGGQDPAGDPAPGGGQSCAGEAGGAGSQPGLCLSHWPRLLLWLVRQRGNSIFLQVKIVIIFHNININNIKK